MAEKRNFTTRTQKTILASSNQATSKYGFAGEHGSIVTGAPKMGDMWFIEFINADSGSSANDISSFAKTVSPITISSDVVSVDRYGKRVHIPVYANFTEVSVSLYDKVDGSGFTAANNMYSKFFKNADLQTDNGNLESAISDINSGRKFTDNPDTSYIKSFRKIVIYHFFGNFIPTGSSPSGSIQKIEIINPLITSITFSGSDYSDSSPRTVDLTFQPENVIFGVPTNNVTIPEWMRAGLEYLLEDMDPSASLERINQQTVSDGVNKDQDMAITALANGNIDANDPRGRDQRGIFGVSDEETAHAQLARLNRLNTALKFLESNPDATDAEKAEALKKFKDEISKALPMPASALKTNVPDDGLRGTNGASNEIKDLITSELISDYMNGKPLKITNQPNSNLFFYNGKPLNVGAVNNNLNNLLTRSGKTKYEVDGNNFNNSLAHASEFVSTTPQSNTVNMKGIGGEVYIPGQPMSQTQVAAIDTALMMGNPEPTGQELRDYKNGKALLATDQAVNDDLTPRESKQANIDTLRFQTGGAR